MHHIEIYKIIAQNSSFLKVLFTEKHIQIAAVAIPMGEGTGEEQRSSDQVVVVLLGEGVVEISQERKEFKEGDLFCIPAKSTYVVENLSRKELKLLWIVAPKAFMDNTNQGSKISEIMDPFTKHLGKGI